MMKSGGVAIALEVALIKGFNLMTADQRADLRKQLSELHTELTDRWFADILACQTLSISAETL